MNAAIHAAGMQWEADQREQARENQTSAGAASASEKEDLVESQDERAEEREALEGQPDLADQLDALADGPLGDPEGDA